MDILSQHQAPLFISSVPGVKELHSHSQTWLMSGCDTAELLSIYRKILFVSQSQEAECSTLIGPDLTRYSALIGGNLLFHNNTPQGKSNSPY